MKQSRRIALVFIVSAALLAAAALVLKEHCPASGFAFSTERRELHRLKNRTAIPQPADVDPAVTLEKMLEPGDDRERWSQTRAAKVEGYVVSVANGPFELTNCYVPGSYDIHIHIGLRPDSPPREQVVLEITPRMQDWARRQRVDDTRDTPLNVGRNEVGATPGYLGRDWSEETLRKEMIGRWCSFEGWLLYDSHHANEAENTAPGRADNWRATAWEVHPITNFEIRSNK